jgi:uncharacterized protein YbbK (DUF523 family)
MVTVGSAPVRIGISSCLLGERVRYDGGHKRDDALIAAFGRSVEWVPVCPEVEMGMGVPREPIRLVDDAPGIRLVGTQSGTDYTDAMRTYASERMRMLHRANLCGYILKTGSPSCGLERVSVYGRIGALVGQDRGQFAAVLLEAFPNLPIEEEGRLAEPCLRREFVERVFAYRRLCLR